MFELKGILHKQASDLSAPRQAPSLHAAEALNQLNILQGVNFFYHTCYLELFYF